jgi:solute:Na+ symporter, SSS family
MQKLDWIILTVTLLFIVIYGVWKTKGSKNVEDYILGNNETPWYVVGLSVMATQASAITFLSTPGQAYHDGMGFVQFYFGLPIAMVVICVTFIPIYHRLKVFTAYEYLEQRFDLKTRSLAAILFLFQRGLGTGLTIYAPAIILSTLLGYWCFGYYLHFCWRNKSCKCDSKTSNVCNNVWNVYYFFLDFASFTK